MRTRIIAGVIAGAGLIALIYFGNPWLVMTVVLASALLSYLEFDRLFFAKVDLARQIRMGALVALSLFAIWQNQMAGWFSLWVAFILLAVVHVIASNRSGDFSGSLRAMTLEFFGLVYVIGLLGFVLPILELPLGRHFVFLLFFLVFMGDTGAYFFGSWFGKHRLASKVSPKKSIEGAVAGVVASTVAALIWLFLVVQRADDSSFFWRVVLAAPVLSVLAQFGDLMESVLKRSQAQKDSGHFLPGHGGILDRIDGLALVAPVYYLYLTLVLEKV